jgi:equilibrative nucleoside transporter 1/2/3
LVFNAADFCGRAFANVYPRGAPRGKCVFGCALARLGLVPPLLACNVVVPGRWNFPRFLSRFDAAPFVLVAALAFTNGHLASVCMMYGPSRVPHRTRADEGVKMSFACIAGLGAGSVLSYALNASMQA